MTAISYTAPVSLLCDIIYVLQEFSYNGDIGFDKVVLLEFGRRDPLQFVMIKGLELTRNISGFIDQKLQRD